MTQEEIEELLEQLDSDLDQARKVVSSLIANRHQLRHQLAEHITAKYAVYVGRKVRIIYEKAGKQCCVEGFFEGINYSELYGTSYADVYKITKAGTRGKKHYGFFDMPTDKEIREISFIIDKKKRRKNYGNNYFD